MLVNTHIGQLFGQCGFAEPQLVGGGMSVLSSNGILKLAGHSLFQLLGQLET